MTEYSKQGRGRIHLHSIPIDPLSHELAHASEISTEEARKVLLHAVNSIPDADLKHLRGGQILIIK
jgi:hypothetical protein